MEHSGIFSSGDVCMFPFYFAGRIHSNCVEFGSDRPWCATANLQVDPNAWDFCEPRKYIIIVYTYIIMFIYLYIMYQLIYYFYLIFGAKNFPRVSGKNKTKQIFQVGPGSGPHIFGGLEKKSSMRIKSYFNIGLRIHF